MTLIKKCSAPAPTIHPVDSPNHTWANLKFHCFDNALGKRRRQFGFCVIMNLTTMIFESCNLYKQNTYCKKHSNTPYQILNRTILKAARSISKKPKAVQSSSMQFKAAQRASERLRAPQSTSYRLGLFTSLELACRLAQSILLYGVPHLGNPPPQYVSPRGWIFC